MGSAPKRPVNVLGQGYALPSRLDANRHGLGGDSLGPVLIPCISRQTRTMPPDQENVWLVETCARYFRHPASLQRLNG